MTGLFDTFQRHYAVLTNFPGNKLESRPYWPGGGYCPGSTREGRRADRPGPAGVGAGVTVPRGRCSQTTHSSPTGASGARFAVWPPLSGCGTSVLDPGITHPVYPPGTTHPVPIPHPVPTTRDHRTGVPERTNSRSGHPVGEPRGSRTQPKYGPRLVIYSYLLNMRFTRPFDWVLY